jgi:hypothetical protein
MDKLKDLLQNKEAIAEIRKLVLPILLVALGFGLGYKSVPAPTKRSVCGKDLDDLAASKTKVGNLEAQVTKLKGQVSGCQDACTKRVNAEADVQKKKCSEEKAKAKEQQKKNLTAFTCAKCKQRGYCK